VHCPRPAPAPFGSTHLLAANQPGLLANHGIALPCSHNGIEQLEGLHQLVNLKILDIANNRIKRLEGLEALQVCCRAGEGGPACQL
jgi:hypothetical protein